MAFAQGSRHDMSYVAESVFGTTPTTPDMKALRYTSTSLALTKEAFVSEEIRSDRQIEDFRHGNRQAGGEIGFELSYGALDDMLESVMFSTWASDVLKAGTALKSFTFERRHLDVAQYLRYTGCVANSLTLSIQPNQMVTGTLGFIGKGINTATTSLGSPAAAPTNSPFDSFTGELKEGGSVIANVTGIELNLENGVEPNFVIGSAETPQLSFGRSNLTGTLTAFFEDTVLLEKFLNETESSIEIELVDTAGNKMIFDIPRIKYSGADNPVEGEGSVVVSLPFQALRDTGEGSQLVITREDAPAPD